MNGTWLLFPFYIGVLLLLSAPFGHFLTRVFNKDKTMIDPVCRPVERLVYRLAGVSADQEMGAGRYILSLLLFNAAGLVLCYAIQRLQGHLPWNPQHFPGVGRELAFNTAASFTTNTNWQAYSGETTMSYFTQMTALTVQNFVSAATGIAVIVALTRGLIRKTSDNVGNFWFDLTRSVVYVLLPLSMVVTVILVSQGVIQNLLPYRTIDTLEGAKQTIAMGPVASQESIKMLGTNGGGFFNANSAHPFENPTPLTNFIEMLSIFLIPTSLVFMFGKMTGDRRQGLAILGAMLLLFAIGLSALYFSEKNGNPILSDLGVAQPTAMEGKEVRFGIADTSLFASITTGASCGAVIGMHDSLTPLGGLVPLFFMMTGEVIFGGVGAGLYGMLVFVILTVFIVGLMVGRTPEYLGKKIEPQEMKMAVIAILAAPMALLLGSAAASVLPSALKSLNNGGPHGLSEILYAFASAANNNGSAFAGLNADTPFYNGLLGLAMLIGRFAVIIPALAIAGSLAKKKIVPPGPGTFPTTGATFSLLLAVIVVMVGALTFFPALALGPVVEHLLMHGSRLF